jgi:hypothetical protein
MSVTNPGSEARTALITRVKNILLKPKDEWSKIDTEAATIPGLYTGYVMLLAAIPAVASLIGGLVFGYGVFGITFRPSIFNVVTSAIVQYVMTLAGVFILALIIDFLAPTFNGQKNQIQAVKLAAYAGTAGWLAGIFALVPSFSILAILGLYSVYLLYVGLPVLMKTPADKALPYTATILIAGIVMGVIFAFVMGMVMPRHMASGQSGGTLSGQVKLPGGTSVDVGAIAQAAKTIEAAANQAAASQAAKQTPSAPGSGEALAPVMALPGSGGAPVVNVIDPDALKGALPGSLTGGFQKGEVSSATGGVAGVGGSMAKSEYTNGNSRLTLTFTDLGALGAMAALGGAFGAQSSEETATHYSRMKTVDGRMTMEEYDRGSNSGTYSVMVGNRVMVEVEGSDVSMDQIKAAMQTVDLGAVQKLVK